MEYVVRVATSKGQGHRENEDCYVCNDRFIVLADGMGGESDGEVASKLAVETVSSILKNGLSDDMAADELQRLAFDAIHKADDCIMSHVADEPSAAGMGTTIVILIRQKQNLYIAWCGDSRCYVYNPKRGIHSLTKDHSYVQDLVDAGRITVDESYTHPDSNLITRFVGGGSETCIPDFTTCCLHPRDIVVACSDGLSGYCRDRAIEEQIENTSDKEQLPAALLNLALVQGSDDDITVITLMSQNSSCLSEGSLFGWFKRKYRP